MNEVQEKELEILKEIIKIIDSHNLTYFAIGGTCLGAVRHKGFIPWDDDIDIAMPRIDYELFRTKFYKELPEKYKKIDCDNVKDHNFLFFKIHDSTTTYVEKYAEYSPERYSGVFVDIMPVDGLPEKKWVKSIIIRYVRLLNRLNRCSRPIRTPSKNIHEKIINILKKYFSKTHRFNLYSDKVLSFMKKFDYSHSKRILFTWRLLQKGSTYKMDFSKEYFTNQIRVPFENSMIAIPENFDSYLREDFGNYMVLPKVSQQKSIHDVVISDLTKPCSYYAEIKRKEMRIIK